MENKVIVCNIVETLNWWYTVKIPPFVLNGYSARDSGYRAATNINYMEYEKPSFLAQSAIMMADCQRKPCGRPSCVRKPSGTH